MRHECTFATACSVWQSENTRVHTMQPFPRLFGRDPFQRLEREQENQIRNGTFTGFGFRALKGRPITILPSGMFCTIHYPDEVHRGYILAHIRLFKCPAFRDIELIECYDNEIYVAYRTEDQFVAGMRTILENTGEEVLNKVICVSADLPWNGANFPLCSPEGCDILCQFRWLIQVFDIHEPMYLLKPKQLALCDIRMHVDAEFQKAL